MAVDLKSVVAALDPKVEAKILKGMTKTVSRLPQEKQLLILENVKKALKSYRE